MTINVRIAFALFCALATTLAARAQDAVDRLDMKAHAAYEAQNYDLAIQYWSDALKLDPNNSTDFFNRALAHAGKNEADKALADFSEAIRLDPKDADFFEQRAEIYKKRGDDAKAAADEVESFKLGLSQSSSPRDWAMDKAYEAQTRGSVALALMAWSEVLKDDPSNMRAWLNRAEIYVQLGEQDKAIADFSEIIRLDPKDTGAYRSRGKLHETKRDYAGALRDYTAVIEKTTDPESGYQWRGQVYFEMQDWDKAIADANSALQIDPTDLICPLLRGAAYARKGDYDKAVVDFEKNITDHPTFCCGYDAEARLLATCADAKVRNGALAIEFAQKACEVTTWKNAGCIDTLAAAEAEAGNWDDAIKFAKKAVETGRTYHKTEKEINDYASRIPLYEQKKPYRELPNFSW